jgi:hypothetical protein
MTYLRHHFGQPPVMTVQGLVESVRRGRAMGLLDDLLHEIVEVAASLMCDRASFVTGRSFPPLVAGRPNRLYG